MAESFLCCGEWVHLSSGATESLLEGWERLARADAGRPGMAEVAACLRNRLDREGAGCRAFGMDWQVLPDELARPAEASALLTLIERTVSDPTLIPDVKWSPGLIMWWRGLLARMAAALRAAGVRTDESLNAT